MIPQEFEYARPLTLDEALAMLAAGNAKVLAGGMSLIPLMKLRLASPERVVDVARIPGLNYIREEGGELHIGATATHYQVESSAVVRERCPLLAETAAHIGDPQVRNRGTIGGSVAHADPASDYPAALFALEAKIVVAGPGATRTLSMDDFVMDTFTTALEPGEMVREVLLPVTDGAEGSSYQKVVHPASGFAIVGIAARVRKAAGAVAAAWVGVTGLGPKAYRAHGVEQALMGKSGSAAEIQQAVAGIADGVEANTDIHTSGEYRKHLARIYGARAITMALSRAR